MRGDGATPVPPRWPWRRRARRYVSHLERVLGTSLELQVTAASRPAAERAETAALAEVDRLEAILSGYSRTSELARWQATLHHDVPVSAELGAVLEAAEEWRQRTAGAFHPGAQALIDLLRDGEVGAGSAPEASAVTALIRELRGPLWVVDRARGTARRLTAHALSLDALAKGYVVDRAAEAAFAVEGVSEVLLNVGGDLRRLGSGRVPVGIADPLAPAENAPLLASVALEDGALATSGGYRRGFRSGGRWVSHLVDPRTGRPAERILSASVVAPDCATADALSTAFSVLAPRESVGLADSIPSVACLLMAADGSVIASDGWNARALSRAGRRALPGPPPRPEPEPPR
jgi:thiamine biosynthesis lipoprotein